MTKTPMRYSFIVAAAASFCISSGCMMQRSAYYSDLRDRRSERYRRWEERDFNDRDLPTISGNLSLDEAVHLALTYNTGLLTALQQKAEADGRVVEAYSEVLPRIDAAADYTRLDQVSTVDIGVDSFQIGDLDNYSYRVTVTQPVFTAKAPIAIRASRLFSYLTDEVIRGVVEDVVDAVAQAYYGTVLARHQIAVQSDALEAAQAHLKSVQSRKDNGMATEFDVLRAKVDVSNIQADLIEQKNQRNVARARLLKAMGVSQRSDIELSTPLSYERTRVEFQDAVRTAFENRPDIYQAILNVDLQREAVNELYSRYLPTVEAYFWNLWSKPDPHESSEIDWGDQWQAGLSLTWPLFDGLAREGRIMQGKAILRQRELTLTDTEEQALLEIRSALDELQNARELVQSQELNLERAEEALKLVRVGYQEGVNTEVEVIDARAALTRAKGLHYTALHRHTISRIMLQRAMGILGARPGSRSVPERVPDIGHVTNPADHPARDNVTTPSGDNP